MNWVEFKQVTLAYGRKTVIENLSLALAEGSSVGLVGPNGAGKTTILKAMLGLHRPLRGEIHRPLHERSRIGYVPQRGHLDELFPFTLGEITEMGLYGQIAPWGKPGTESEKARQEALAAVGLADEADKLFRDLSGGQKQRALLARALIARPNILVLDEPTHGLDIAQAKTLMTLLDSLRETQGLSLVVVSHNLPEILRHSQFVLLLHQGRLAFHGPVEDLTDDLLSNLYQTKLRIRDLAM